MTQKGKTCKFRWNTVIHNSNEKPNFMPFFTLNNIFLPKMLHSHNSNHRHQFCQNLVVTKDSERFAVLKLE